MGANSAQGVAVLVFLLAFVFLSLAMFSGGNILWLIVAAVTFGASVPMFQKARRIEFGGE